MNERFDIVIVGAGVVGLATALLLARSGAAEQLTITVLDAQPVPRFDTGEPMGLRVSAMSAGSINLLDSLGVIDDVFAARACPYRDMRVWDAGGAADGAAALHFSAAEFALPQLGFIVEDALLRSSLLRCLEASAVQLRFGTGIQAMSRAGSGQQLTLCNGEQLRAALVIGADGARSAVRGLANIEVDGWQYAQAALVTHAQCATAHQHTAWQRFMTDGPLALLPLKDGRVSIVWSTQPERAKHYSQAAAAELSRALTDASDLVLGELQVDAGCATLPLRAQHARHYVQQGIALVGDAAHTVHPLAGQGANLGLADAAVLATVLENALVDGQYPGDLPVLRRYERARRGANGTMLRFIDGLSRLFQVDSRWVETVRGTGMQVFEHSGALKRQAMRTALGLDTIRPARQGGPEY
jgi:2-polyprenylphenol 6-hydroxylase